MATVEAEEVYTRDLSSGTVHKRWLIPGSDELKVNEADNLDDAGEYEVVADLDGIEQEDLCQRCFPEPIVAPV